MDLKLPITFYQLWIVAPVAAVLTFGGTWMTGKMWGKVAFLPLIALCVAGALIGVLAQLKWLKILLRCPYCKLYGRLTFGYQNGFSEPRPLFECPACKKIVNRSYFWINLDKDLD